MRARIATTLMLSVSVIMLIGAGCEKPTGGSADCAIAVVVVDASTEAPIDSAQVFLTYVDLSFPPYVGKRRLAGVTDDNGRLYIFPVGCHGIHIVEVEKEGYLTEKQTEHGSGDLYFALQPIPRIGLELVPAA